MELSPRETTSPCSYTLAMGTLTLGRSICLYCKLDGLSQNSPTIPSNQVIPPPMNLLYCLVIEMNNTLVRLCVPQRLVLGELEVSIMKRTGNFDDSRTDGFGLSIRF